MACPLCGEQCHCRTQVTRAAARAFPGVSLSSSISAPDPGDWLAETPLAVSGIERMALELQQLQARDDLDRWRDEVASRVDGYRTRRSRKSLAGQFSMRFDPPPEFRAPEQPAPEPKTVPPPLAPAKEAPAPWSARAGGAPASCTAAALAWTPEQPASQEPAEAAPAEARDTHRDQEAPRLSEPGNLIAFPRGPLMAPEAALDELAERITNRPRILDAPETVETASPLAGITLDELEEDDFVPPLPAFELPLQVAPVGLRVRAAVVDWLVVLAASAVFAAIACQLAPALPHSRATAGAALTVPFLFWAVYYHIFLSYAGVTPGMLAAHLDLSSFDGGPVLFQARRWRACMMALSCLSVGLGFFWALADEDTLCWHDKITRTYLTRH